MRSLRHHYCGLLTLILCWIGVAAPSLWAADHLTVSMTFTIADTPTSIDLNGGAAGTDYATTFTEDGPGVAIVDAAGLTLSDPDQLTVEGAVITLTNPQDGVAEQLSLTIPVGLSANYNAGTGVLTVSGTATLGVYQTALRTLMYANSSQAPGTTDRIITVAVDDGWSLGPAATATVSITALPDVPVVDLNGGGAGIDHAAIFTIFGGPASIVDASALTVTDPDLGNLTQAQAHLMNRPDGVLEVLNVTTSGGITKSYDSSTGVLTLTGPAAIASFQNVLRTLTYDNANNNPDVTDRIIEVTVSDGTATSVVATSTVSLVANANRLVVLPASTAGTPLITDENGAIQLVSVRLSTIASGPVQVLLGNPAADEVSLSATTLNFTPANWNLFQTVLITGVPDGLVDGDQLVPITVSVSAPATNYAGVTAADIVVRNRDRDVPGLTVTASGGTTVVQEGGAGDSVTVVLSARPAGTVTVSLTSSGQVVVSPNVLNFDDTSWNLPQTVTITAVDDNLVNGTRAVMVQAAATGSAFDGVTRNIAVTVLDNDVAGVEVTPTTGLITSENGQQAQVNLRLRSQPTAHVTVPLSSSNPAEGAVLAPATLTFTPANWNSYQTVTIAGVADGIADGDQPWILVSGLTSSTDAAYDQLNPPDAAIINRDTDRPALMVTPLSVVVDESGATVHLQVKLGSQPAGNVTVNAVSSDTSEATLAPGSVTFTGGSGGNWNTLQDIVVTGIPDGIPDGNQAFTVTLTASDDAVYAALAPVVVTGLNQDTNAPTVLLDLPPVLALTEGVIGTVSYGVRLSTDPGASTIIVTPTAIDGQLSVISGPLSFDSGNYTIPQTVTLGVVNDLIAEGAHSGQVQHAVTGSYQSVTLTVPITDNDNAGIIITPQAGLLTTEIGGTATCSVHLLSQPTGPVTIPFTSSDTAQGTVSPATLTFTPSGGTAWNLDQTITITGADGNAFDDGDEPYQVQSGPATSSDAFYQALFGPTVGVVNQRVDHPPTINAIADLNISEDAGPQSVALTGISNGQAGEIQAITLTASSSDTALTGPLVVTYGSPATTGSIAFTPTAQAFGTATITVQVGDGATTVTRSFQVQVAPVNDRPAVVLNTPLVVDYRATGTYQGAQADPLAPGQLTASDVETAAAALVYRIVLAPAGGFIALSGGPLTTGDSFTQAQIQAGLVTYTHNGAAGASDGFLIQVEDTDGGQGDPVVVPITIIRYAPVVSLDPPAGATWTEGDGPLTIAPTALVSDADSTTFDTGSCTVSLASGGLGDDLLALRDDGNGAGQIGVSGNTVSFGGVPFGSIAGGRHPAPLVVSFNAQASMAAVQALVRAITFTNLGDHPGSISRVIRVVLVDDHGDTSTAQDCTIIIQPINQPPTMTAMTLSTVSGLGVAGTLTASDTDGPALSFAVTSPPTQGTLTSFDASSGSFVYTPAITAVGSDSFQVVADDGLATSAVTTITIIITSPASSPRLWITSDAPMEAQTGERLRWTVHVDTSELTLAPDLRFDLIAAPAGMILAADPANAEASVTWPAVAGSGHVLFQVRVWDTVSGISEVQQVCILVHPTPAAIARSAAPAGEQDLRTSRSLIAILSLMLLGVMLSLSGLHSGRGRREP